MKKFKLPLIALLVAGLLTIAFIGCKKDLKGPTLTSDAKPVASGSCNYTITLANPSTAPACVNYTGASTIFEWTITFPTKTNSGGEQNVSHLDLILNDCVVFTDIVGVYVTDNFAHTTTCLSVTDFTYQIDKSANCTGTAVLKYDVGGASGQYTYGLVLRGSYGTATTTAFVKSGAFSGCCQFSIAGPGCPNNVGSCNLSQGYWFVAPNTVWCESVTLGSYTYTQADGEAIWNTSNSGGISAAKRAFTQYCAIALDRDCQAQTLPQNVIDAMTTIEGILGTVQLTSTNIQSASLFTATQNTSLIAAQQVISDYIGVLEVTNKCN